MERTLVFIKPDAVARGLIGKIVSSYEKEKIKIIAIRMHQITKKEARQFYLEHKGKPFYESLVAYITSGPEVLLVLEGENIIARNRQMMGATDPAKAAPGTIRKTLGVSLEKNSIHGSDSLISAKREVAFFFPHLANF